MLKQRKMADRLHAAFQMQVRYCVPPPDMAFLFGFSEKNYHRRLVAAGLDVKKLDKLNDTSGTNSAMLKLQAELTKIIEAQGLPDKASADALTALAKTVKSVLELQQEAATHEVTTDIVVTDTAVVNKVLGIIDDRINELANYRATELLRHRFEPASIKNTNE